MRRWALIGLGTVALSLALFSGQASASERLDGLDAVAVVQPNGDLAITETITWDFDGEAKKHGIFRFVPRLHRWTLDRKPGWADWQQFDRVTPVAFSDASSPTGANAERHVETKGDNEVLRLGNKNVLVSGVQKYQLHYMVGRAVVNDTLRYAISGKGWTVTNGAITARITAPVAAGAVPTCVVGSVPAPRCDVRVDGDNVFVTAYDLASEVVVPLDVSRVTAPAPVFEEHQTFRRAFDWTNGQPIGAVVLAALSGAALWVVGRRGRDLYAAGGGVIGGDGATERPRSLTERLASPVEFAPPEGVLPGMVGAIRGGKVDHVALSSTLVDLAVRGHVGIEALSDGRSPDHALVAKDAGKGDLRAYESTLLSTLMGGSSRVLISELKANKTIHAPLATVRSGILDEVVKAGYWVKRPDRVKGKWVALGILAAILGGFITIVLAASSNKALLGLPFVMFGLGLIALAPTMPVRTAAGSRLKARLDGFEKLFDAGEGERIAITEKAEVFSQYLPFAMAFGNVKQWVKRFSAIGHVPDTSSWYVYPYGVGFDHFSSALDGFDRSLSSAMAAASASPSSSSGGGGGGSSSGGGGGGSW